MEVEMEYETAICPKCNKPHFPSKVSKFCTACFLQEWAASLDLVGGASIPDDEVIAALLDLHNHK
jgi:hypothetical protein